MMRSVPGVETEPSPSAVLKVSNTISAAAPESFGKSATSGEASTKLPFGSPASAFHEHCSAGENWPTTGTPPLQAMPGGTLFGKHTAAIAPSLRQVASQQYVSLWQSSDELQLPLTLPHLPTVVHTYWSGDVHVGPDRDGEVFALHGKHFASVQFHPESLLTRNGAAILSELLESLIAAHRDDLVSVTS